MVKLVTVRQYLSSPEQLTPQELEWGVVRDSAAPWSDHQAVVGTIYFLLSGHVRWRGLGDVFVAPLDVVLDVERALVVQPDVLFVSAPRREIVRRQVWGSPDLVVEVASPTTARRDRTTKLGWYRQYGVRECWLADPARRRLAVVDLAHEGRGGVRFYRGADRIRSGVLPEWDLPAEACFS